MCGLSGQRPNENQTVENALELPGRLRGRGEATRVTQKMKCEFARLLVLIRGWGGCERWSRRILLSFFSLKASPFRSFPALFSLFFCSLIDWGMGHVPLVLVTWSNINLNRSAHSINFPRNSLLKTVLILSEIG